MIKQIANIITGLRILCSILLLFFPVFGAGFYIIYLLCGFSDMIDGTVARKTNSISEFGSKIDTIADLVFVAVSLIKLFPIILSCIIIIKIIQNRIIRTFTFLLAVLQ